MLLEATDDPVLIEVLQKITRAETQEEMDAGFEELQLLGEVRERQFREAVDKVRREEKIPRRAGQGELEAAAEEWGALDVLEQARQKRAAEEDGN